jgi:hypothetical protein
MAGLLTIAVSLAAVWLGLIGVALWAWWSEKDWD